jgi:hypothetical protein
MVSFCQDKKQNEHLLALDKYLFIESESSVGNKLFVDNTLSRIIS